MFYFVWASTKLLVPNWPIGSGNRIWGATCGITPEPLVEESWQPANDQVHILTPQLPLWLAELVHTRLFRMLPAAGAVFGAPPATGVGQKIDRFAHFKRMLWRRQAQKITAAWGWHGQKQPDAWGWQGQRQVGATKLASSQHSSPLAAAVEDVQYLLEAFSDLATRQLTEQEVAADWAKAGMTGVDLAEILHRLVATGWLARQAAVGGGNNGRFSCRRCGSWRQVRWEWCASCGGNCPTCDACAQIGRLRGCMGLYARTLGSEPSTPSHLPVNISLPYQLTAAQLQAAALVEEAVNRGRRQVLVWAACGAGKTEVSYRAIARVVNDGARALLLAPRRDVVADLCTRLQGVFGADQVCGWWGGSDAASATAPIVVATTHQAIRFISVFRLVVLDECDAYPYAGDAQLQRVVERLAARATLVQMTATPAPGHLLASRFGLLQLVCIPARHHGHPLPVPQICISRDLASWLAAIERLPSSPLPRLLAEVVQATVSGGGQLLMFVPQRKQVDAVVGALASAIACRVMGAHAQSGKRDELRERLLAREVDIAVTTSIFERGLTFPAVDVAVVGADAERIFSAASLVQMAGRVGRTTGRPYGNVYFFSQKNTSTMRAAVSLITELNQRARDEFLLTSQ